MSQFSACTLKFGPNLKHPFLFCVCKLKIMQRKHSDPQSSTDSTVVRQEPQTLHYPPGTLICTWDIHMGGIYEPFTGKPSGVGDVCYFSEAPLLHYPQGFHGHLPNLLPIHLAYTVVCQFQNRSSYFPSDRLLQEGNGINLLLFPYA